MRKGAAKNNLAVKLLSLLGKIPLFIVLEVLQILIILEKKTRYETFATFKPTFTATKRGRGRPRTKPFLTFYKDKLNKALKSIPKPIRWGTVMAAVLGFLFVYSLSLINIARQLPTPSDLKNNSQFLTTEFYDRHGRLLYKIFDGQDRKLVKLEELPPHLIQATIAIEDKNFFTHPGIDFFGILRALRFNSQKGNGRLQGGSTITQQLIKNTLLTSDKTFGRKIKEAMLAFWAERVYSKNQILQMYFNEAPYGGPARGVVAASEMYFAKHPKDLTLSEAAFLAALPAAPTEYSPYGTNPNKGLERQKQVLGRMTEDGYLSEAQAVKATEQHLSFKPPIIEIKAPHFVFYVKSLLEARYGAKLVSSGGLKVTTTLDLDIQEMVEQVVKKQVEQLHHLNLTNGAAMVTDPKTGQILAMQGSKDYFDNQGDGNFNVTAALRPPGSSIKVITYATAFKQGFSPASVILDVPTNFSDPVTGVVYAPLNYDGRFHGPVSIRVALGSSYNLPAVKVLKLVGLDAFLDTARDLGITTFIHPQHYGLSITLGGADVKMVDMMTVYGSLATGGIKYPSQPILKITDQYGRILEDNGKADGKKVLTEQVAYLITHILSDKKAREPGFGPNSLLEIPNKVVAVKTGTSDSKKDNWTFGFTTDYVVGAWVGNNNNLPMHPSLTSGISGATPIWHEIIKKLLEDKDNIAFERPTGITEATVDGQKDLAISGQIPKTVMGVKRTTQKEEGSDSQKEIITYTDPFSSITSDKLSDQNPN